MFEFEDENCLPINKSGVLYVMHHSDGRTSVKIGYTTVWAEGRRREYNRRRGTRFELVEEFPTKNAALAERLAPAKLDRFRVTDQLEVFTLAPKEAFRICNEAAAAADRISDEQRSFLTSNVLEDDANEEAGDNDTDFRLKPFTKDHCLWFPEGHPSCKKFDLPLREFNNERGIEILGVELSDETLVWSTDAWKEDPPAPYVDQAGKTLWLPFIPSGCDVEPAEIRQCDPPVGSPPADYTPQRYGFPLRPKKEEVAAIGSEQGLAPPACSEPTPTGRPPLSSKLMASFLIVTVCGAICVASQTVLTREETLPNWEAGTRPEASITFSAEPKTKEEILAHQTLAQEYRDAVRAVNSANPGSAEYDAATARVDEAHQKLLRSALNTPD
ncbi:MAG: GIY-YIG nuclease family protein [Shimia sp.]|uniref:GIY-YIG nuclease family protein n=1 Tax=Shimia sp. TaxID=1954381 RepID=UPI001B275164|nr:GIY-YIG nuclease family protein [Shimia sp.]MBO6899550.1 GIY-YIG nuclease family protein [Shimia sp.]